MIEACFVRVTVATVIDVRHLMLPSCIGQCTDLHTTDCICRDLWGRVYRRFHVIRFRTSDSRNVPLQNERPVKTTLIHWECCHERARPQTNHAMKNLKPIELALGSAVINGALYIRVAYSGNAIKNSKGIVNAARSLLMPTITTSR